MEHNHNHSIESINYSKVFAIGIILNVAYIIVELSSGFIINSMALISDAVHNFSDVLGLMIAWGATILAKSSPTKKRTYGYRKSTIIAPLINSLILLVAVGGIFIESIRKFYNPSPIQGNLMMLVAGIGIVINSLTAILFFKGKEKDINIKGTFLHMAADAAVSFGVVIAGLVINFTNWLWIDPVISLIIAFVIIIGTWNLLKDSFMLSMDAVPNNINLKEVESYLKSLDGITDVHDLHIWGMSATAYALTVHLVVDNYPDDNKFIQQINENLFHKFGIEHPTIQLELTSQAYNCEKCN